MIYSIITRQVSIAIFDENCIVVEGKSYVFNRYIMIYMYIYVRVIATDVQMPEIRNQKSKTWHPGNLRFRTPCIILKVVNVHPASKRNEVNGTHARFG